MSTFGRPLVYAQHRLWYANSSIFHSTNVQFFLIHFLHEHLNRKIIYRTNCKKSLFIQKSMNTETLSSNFTNDVQCHFLVVLSIYITKYIFKKILNILSLQMSTLNKKSSSTKFQFMSTLE